MAAVDVHAEDEPRAEQGSGRASLRARRCIVSRLSGDTGELIRFVRAPDGAVVPDIRENLPGRGCWVAAKRSYVARAVDRKLFARAFKAESRADSNLADLVERRLREDALGMLAITRKAGALILGEMQVVAAARNEPLACVIHASDGARNGLKKVLGALQGSGRSADTVVVREFTGEELSLALGMANVIHAGLPAGRLGTAFAQKARKLAAYRGNGGADAAIFTSDRSTGPADIGQDPGS